jgi:hypothetical protein
MISIWNTYPRLSILFIISVIASFLYLREKKTERERERERETQTKDSDRNSDSDRDNGIRNSRQKHLTRPSHLSSLVFFSSRLSHSQAEATGKVRYTRRQQRVGKEIGHTAISR